MPLPPSRLNVNNKLMSDVNFVQVYNVLEICESALFWAPEPGRLPTGSPTDHEKPDGV